MEASSIVHPFLFAMVAAGLTREEITNACRDWVRGASSAPQPAPATNPNAVTNLQHTFLEYFPGIEEPEGDFFTKALAAANGNEEVASAVLDILRQNRERGEWRDESFPAGLVFWFLKNKEHEKLRKQGYAIRMQRKDSVSVAEEIGEPTEPPEGFKPPKPAPVETQAFQPSPDGLAKLKAAVGSLPKRPVDRGPDMMAFAVQGGSPGSGKRA